MPGPAHNNGTFLNPLHERLLPPTTETSAPGWTVRASQAFVKASTTIGAGVQKTAARAIPPLQRAATQTKEALTAAAQATATTANKYSEEAAKTAQRVATQAAESLKPTLDAAQEQAGKAIDLVMGRYELKGKDTDDLYNQIMQKLIAQFSSDTKANEQIKREQTAIKNFHKTKEETLLRLPSPLVIPVLVPVLTLEVVLGPFVNQSIALADQIKNRDNSITTTNLSGYIELGNALKEKLGQCNSAKILHQPNGITQITLDAAHGEQKTFYVVVTECEKGICTSTGILEEGWRQTTREQNGCNNTFTLTGRFDLLQTTITLQDVTRPEALNKTSDSKAKTPIGSFLVEGTCILASTNNGQTTTETKTGTFKPPSELQQFNKPQLPYFFDAISRLEIARGHEANYAKRIYGLEHLHQGEKTIKKPDGTTTTLVTDNNKGEKFTPVTNKGIFNRETDGTKKSATQTANTNSAEPSTSTAAGNTAELITLDDDAQTTPPTDPFAPNADTLGVTNNPSPLSKN